MKTSVLVGRICKNETVRRACLPAERVIGVNGYNITVVPAHEERFTRLGFMTQERRQVPDQIVVCDYRFDIDARGNVKPHERSRIEARVIDETSRQMLHELDEQIVAINKVRKELIEEAWLRARKLNRKDIET